MGVLLDNVVDGIFIFILLAYSNYANFIIPNQLEKYVFKYVWFQHMIIFSLIYFLVELIGNSEKSPLNNFYNSLVIYGFFILFSRCPIYITFLIILLLASLSLMINQKRFLKRTNENYTDLDQPIDIVTYVTAGVIGLSTIYVVGREIFQNKSFNVLKFYFDRRTEKSDLKIEIPKESVGDLKSPN